LSLDGQQDPSLALLTERQREILALVAKGFTNAEIAGLLDLAAGTVKLHVSAIIERLEVTNRTEAAAVWLGATFATHLDEHPPSRSGPCLCILAEPAGAEPDTLAAAEGLADALGQFLDSRMLHPLDAEASRKIAEAGGERLRLAGQLAATHVLQLVVARVEGPSNAVRLEVGLHLIEVATAASILDAFFSEDEAARAKLVVEIGLDVEAALGIALAPAPTPPDAAEDLYWQGVYNFAKRTPATLQKAVQLFSGAVAARPDHVAAHVGLANVHHQMAVYVPGLSPLFFAEGLKAAQKAVDLDPMDGNAHAAMGYAQMFGQWNRVAARRSLDRALTLDRRRDETLIWTSLWLMFGGEHSEALSVAEEGLAMNPIAIAHFVHLGHVLRSQGALDRAIAHLSLALDMEPANLRATIWMALCQADAGHPRAARSYIDRALAQVPDAGMLLGVAGYIAGVAGDGETAQERLSRLVALRGQPMHSPLFEAFVRIGQGDHDTAMDLVRESLPQKVPMLLGWYCDPVLTRLSGHADYHAMGREIGLPQAATD
jgi:DNA-binding CsgD family transcriptional regulator/tetratricopeptide (TPR) repeat protein